MATRTISPSGGTRNWNDTASWVEVAVPTSADDVVATASSGNLILNVAAVCRSFDMTGMVGTVSGASQLSIGDATGGAFKLVAGMGWTATTAFLFFVSTSDNGGVGWPLTFAGKTVGSTLFTGAGGKWVFQDTFTSSSLSLSNGTLDTNNQAVNFSAFFSQAGVRTLIAGSSIFTASSSGAIWVCSNAGLTMAANTAELRIVASATISMPVGQGLNGMSITMTGATGGSVAIDVSDVKDINYPSIANKNSAIIFNRDCTITGILTATGNSIVNRIRVASNVTGVPRTITAAAIAFSNVNIGDISAAGAANWNLTGTVGDEGGNTGITGFTAPVTRYAVVAGNWSNTAVWSATSGGAGGASVPLPQDDVFLNALSAVGTYVTDMIRLGRNIDCTGFTGTFSMSFGSAQAGGSLILSAGMTLAGANGLTFAGRSGSIITSAGKVFAGTITFNCVDYTLSDDLSLVSSKGITLTAGVINLNTKTIITGSFAASSLFSRGINGGTVSLIGPAGNVWNISASQTGLVISGLAIVVAAASASARVLILGPPGLVYDSVTYNVAASAGSLTITANNITITTLNVSGGVKTLQFTIGNSITVVNWNVNGTAGNLIAISSSLAGTQAMLRSLLPQISQYVSVKDIRASKSIFQATPGGVNNGNNTNWIFGPAVSLAAQSDGVSGASGDLTNPSHAHLVPLAGRSDGVSGAYADMKRLVSLGGITGSGNDKRGILILVDD